MNRNTTALQDVMTSAKNLLQYSQELNVLFVEDDENLRNEMVFLLEPLFKSIETAEHGEAGLEKYNNAIYDLVLTDLNMPRMNGIEFIGKIREINTEQKIMAISAHSDQEVLLDVIRAGVNGFLLKPINQKEAMASLYPICRDAYAQNLNIQLVEELHAEKEKLEAQNRELMMQVNTVKAKHQQVEALLQPNKKVASKSVEESANKVSEEAIKAYFEEDADEGKENVVLLGDHCDDLVEIFNDISAQITACTQDPNSGTVLQIAAGLAKASGILSHYTPYLDQLSLAMSELSVAMRDKQDEFLQTLSHDAQNLHILFDAVCTDMENYVQRFQHESIAMKNAHHIHEPTALSIKQIIAMITSQELDYGDLEFFI